MMKGFAAIAVLLCLTSAHKSGDVKPKWWSIPEPVATVGKLFYFKIPHDSVVDNTGPVDVSIIHPRRASADVMNTYIGVCLFTSLIL